MTATVNPMILELQSHPFCKDFSAAQLAVLAECAMKVSFRAGETIFKEGEMANRFYLIRSGEVTLTQEEAPHEHAEVQLLGAGEVLGWSWLFPPYYWHFSATAKTPVEAIFLYGTKLREDCEQDPALGYELMKRMAEIVIRRLQRTRQALQQLKRQGL
jgi:CRP/FNR family transcriptional regulator, cyclic AMP receptor protein